MIDAKTGEEFKSEAFTLFATHETGTLASAQSLSGFHSASVPRIPSIPHTYPRDTMPMRKLIGAACRLSQQSEAWQVAQDEPCRALLMKASRVFASPDLAAYACTCILADIALRALIGAHDQQSKSVSPVEVT